MRKGELHIPAMRYAVQYYCKCVVREHCLERLLARRLSAVMTMVIVLSLPLVQSCARNDAMMNPVGPSYGDLWRTDPSERTERAFLAQLDAIGSSLRGRFPDEDVIGRIREIAPLLNANGEEPTIEWLTRCRRSNALLYDLVCCAYNDPTGYLKPGGPHTPPDEVQREICLETWRQSVADTMAFRSRLRSYLDSPVPIHGTLVFPTNKRLADLDPQVARDILADICNPRSRCVAETSESFVMASIKDNKFWMFPPVSLLPFCPFGRIQTGQTDALETALFFAFVPDIWSLANLGRRGAVPEEASLLTFVCVWTPGDGGRLFRSSRELQSTLSTALSDQGPMTVGQLASWLGAAPGGMLQPIRTSNGAMHLPWFEMTGTGTKH